MFSLSHIFDAKTFARFSHHNEHLHLLFVIHSIGIHLYLSPTSLLRHLFSSPDYAILHIYSRDWKGIYILFHLFFHSRLRLTCERQKNIQYIRVCIFTQNFDIVLAYFIRNLLNQIKIVVLVMFFHGTTFSKEESLLS